MQARFAHPDARLLHFLWPGDWIGSLEVLVDRTRRYSALARTDVALLQVPAEAIRLTFRRHPEAAACLGYNAVYGLDLAMQCAADLLIRDVRARSAAVILRLAGRRWASTADEESPVCIPVTQSELAMLCNCSRKTFSGVVAEFDRLELITHSYRSLTVRDAARLRTIAIGMSD